MTNFSPDLAIQFACATYQKAKETNQKITINVNSRLSLIFPGKLKYGDYQAQVEGKALPHIAIVESLHNITDMDNADHLVKALEYIYQNGTSEYFVSDILSSEFQDELFWIPLQEEVNYPQTKKKSNGEYFHGRRLALSRYLEGVVSKLPGSPLSLNDVKSRTNNHGQPVPDVNLVTQFLTQSGLLVPSFYY